MKKSIIQISSFLANSSFKSDQDLKRILAICQAEDGFSSSINYAIDPENGITLIEFLDWCDNCFGVGDICKIEDTIVICGICTHKCARIVGKLLDDKLVICDIEMPQKALYGVSERERYDFMCVMLSERLQFSFKTLTLIAKYVPQPGERVIFTSPTLSGLGVVKTVHFDTDCVDYFCYYINETERVGYSMNELAVTGLSDVIFEPMNNSALRQTTGNGIYLQRKFNKILGRYGKVWNEKLHRIEPLEVQVPIGQKYYYIDDKMVLRADIEKGKGASKKRSYVGNYFWNIDDAMEFQGRFTAMLRDRLAKPGLNEKIKD